MKIILIILTILFALASCLADECTSPNGISAQCIALEDCKPAYDFILTSKNRPMTLQERQFIGQLQCNHNSPEVPYICCAMEDLNFISLFIENGTVVSTEQRFTDAAHLPNLEYYECGVDILSNRIFGGVDSQLNEFPWIALLEYVKPTGSREFACGGSLINSRYVLTAAHCLVGNILIAKGQLQNVRLGEYNLDTPVDCIYTAYSDLVCAPPVLDMQVESTKEHPDYLATSSNDIGLVRLANYVPEVSHIYPVCLPPSSFKSQLGTYFAVAGWGKTPTAKRSSIIQKLIVPLYNFDDCKYLFRQIRLTNNQMCAGGEAGKDSCNGDSGGPLMTYYRGTWVMEGIVSIGVSTCGERGIPGIYTRVSKFIDWIQANLEP